jgi:serine/threonine protein kinase
MLYGSRNYQYEVDIWAIGCILMELATGQPYFDGKS